MTVPKEYFVLSELQQHCEKLQLPSDGLKKDLIQRIIKFKPKPNEQVPASDDSSCASSSSSSKSTSSSSSTSKLISDQATQTESKSVLNYGVILKVLILFVLILIFAFVFKKIFFEEKKIEIVVKSSWFDF